MNIFPSPAKVAAVLLPAMLAVHDGLAQQYKQGPHTLIYSKAALANVSSVSQTVAGASNVIDAPLTFIRRGAGARVNTLWTSPFGIDWYGPGIVESKNVFASWINFRTQYPKIRHPNPISYWPGMWIPSPTGVSTLNSVNFTGPVAGKVYGFIQNVYWISATEYLGFVHIERNCVEPATAVSDRLYAIGMAYSSDAGVTWKYLGDVIRPSYDAVGDFKHDLNGNQLTDAMLSNIGGVPFLKVWDAGIEYFYVYFNEWVDNMHHGYPAVARIPVANAVTAARAGAIPVLNKFTAGPNQWTQPGLTGLGSPLFGGVNDFAGVRVVDLHSKAAYCVAIRSYLLAVNQAEWDDIGAPNQRFHHKLLLYSSPDGISWTRRITIDSSNTYVPYYPSFVSNAPETSPDNNTIGGVFRVVYSRKDSARVLTGDLYARKISVAGQILPLISDVE